MKQKRVGIESSGKLEEEVEEEEEKKHSNSELTKGCQSRKVWGGSWVDG